MRRIMLIIALAAAPAFAQESEGPGMPDLETPEPGMPELEDPGLVERGVESLLRGLLEELGPALRELRGAVEGLDAYHPPEILPNGDILLRRKTPLVPEAPGEGESIEL